ncbi:serine hydrolase [Sporolactobacillus shoreae]|uniref:Serine hydrolase n=1 Tax=Sporolactobacillus shoreae TaxID=1465501 RepID=A0A4Z0GMN8_9BACL|nr:serine hydrolase [Sporolactobacillus shoreae]TGA97474.1 serine hydrolase [Sporolactobacillus shoreae]
MMDETYQQKKDALARSLKGLSAPFGKQMAVQAVGTDGFYFSLNASQSMLSASLIKLPILLCACDQASRDPESFRNPVQLTDSEIVGGSGVLQILSGRTWSVRDLLALMISVSDNTATNLLIDFLGRGVIQDWIRKNEFSGTILGRKLMDEAAESAGLRNRISAADACAMVERVMTMEGPFSDDVRRWFLHQQFRGKLPALFDELPCPVNVYNKTGEMGEVDHDAACFVCGEHRLTIAVLSEGVGDRQKVLAVIQTIGREIADYLLSL